jgi:hypothetical protein
MTHLAPAESGNQLARKHGVYARLSVAESAEVAEIADELREVMPAPTESDEPILAVIAAGMHRLRKANDVLERSGLMMGSRVHPLVRYVLEAERNLARMLASVGGTTAAKADLGLRVAQTNAARQRPDYKLLSDDELYQLRALMRKASPTEESDETT